MKKTNGKTKLMLWCLGVAFAAGGVFTLVKISAAAIPQLSARITVNSDAIAEVKQAHAVEMGNLKTELKGVSTKQDMMHDDVKWIKEHLK